jgi:hypothetical protein
VRAILDAQDPATAARAADLFATIFWRAYATPARAAAAGFLQSRHLPDSTALATAALLPPAPSHHAPAAPLCDALADALRDPTRAVLAADTFMDALACILATVLQSKSGTASPGGGGSARGATRSNAQHAFVVAATLSVAAQWLRVLPQRAQHAPMLRLARLLFELLTVPKPPEQDDSARHRGSRAGGMNGASSSADADSHLSPISLLLQGAQWFLAVLSMALVGSRVRTTAVACGAHQPPKVTRANCLQVCRLRGVKHEGTRSTMQNALQAAPSCHRSTSQCFPSACSCLFGIDCCPPAAPACPPPAMPWARSACAASKAGMLSTLRLLVKQARRARATWGKLKGVWLGATLRWQTHGSRCKWQFFGSANWTTAR